ncbi:MAG: cupredoxin domain-containing protein [Chloroflexota bacterium]
MHRTRRASPFLFLGAFALMVAACGGAATSPTSPATTPPDASAGQAISVDLSEWKVVPATATASAGSITFTISNKGTQVHEFVVVKTDTMAADIAIVDNKVDESSLAPIDEVEDIAVGDSPTLTVDLQPGHYVLLCNIETHYGQGMHADFDVN